MHGSVVPGIKGSQKHPSPLQSNRMSINCNWWFSDDNTTRYHHFYFSSIAFLFLLKVAVVSIQFTSFSFVAFSEHFLLYFLSFSISLATTKTTFGSKSFFSQNNTNKQRKFNKIWKTNRSPVKNQLFLTAVEVKLQLEEKVRSFFALNFSASVRNTMLPLLESLLESLVPFWLFCLNS